MKTLAIDPAYSGPTGYALFTNDTLIRYGHLEAEAWEWDVRRKLLGLANRLVIEGQYIHLNGQTGRLLNGQTALKLVEARCLWTIPARDHFGIEAHEMQPQEWQSKVQRGWRRGVKKDYALIRQYVEGRFSISGVTQDEASAICIGAVFLDLEKMRGKK